jgi:MFS family permease
VGLGFLPGNLIMAAFSLKLSAWVVNRFGIRGPAAIGLALAALGLLLFSFTPEQGSYWIWVFPGMTLLGIGGGMAFNPLMLAAMNDVPPEDSGLASGVLNTGFMMGGAVGLAGLAAVAAGRSGMLAEAGSSAKAALNGGYHAAFLVSAVCVGLGALLFWMFVRAKAPAGDALPAH